MIVDKKQRGDCMSIINYDWTKGAREAADTFSIANEQSEKLGQDKVAIENNLALRHSYERAMLLFNTLVAFLKLAAAAFAWTFAYMLFKAEDCWAKDYTYHSTIETCGLESLPISGVGGSVGLFAAFLLFSALLAQIPDFKKAGARVASARDLVSLLPSVIVGDGMWSVCAWLGLSLADVIHPQGAVDQDWGFLGWYLLASIPFYTAEAALFKYAQDFFAAGVEKCGTKEVWRSNLPFTLTVAGAYWGFGAPSVMLAKLFYIDTNSKAQTATVNGLGTGLGAMLVWALFVVTPILVQQARERKNSSIVSTRVLAQASLLGDGSKGRDVEAGKRQSPVTTNRTTLARQLDASGDQAELWGDSDPTQPPAAGRPSPFSG